MELNEYVWMVLQGLGVILALGLTVYGLAMLRLNHANAKQQYLALDARLAPFGQTTYGRAAYSAVQQARGQVDSATDPLIQRIMAISLLKELATRKIINAQQLSRSLVFLLDLGGELLDGEADSDIPPVPGAAVTQ